MGNEHPLFASEFYDQIHAINFKKCIGGLAQTSVLCYVSNLHNDDNIINIKCESA